MDSQQHKVIVTGNVEADTLIKKLLRSGKHAELWPEKKEKKSGKSKNNKDQKNIEEDGDAEQKNTDGSNGGIGKDTDGGDTDKEDKESEDVGGESVGGNNGGSGSGGGGGGGGGKKKKKKKKKGQNGNSLNGDGGGVGGENFGDVLPSGGSPMSPHDMAPPIAAMNFSPPHQHIYPYPPMNYPPQVPYGMSYNMAYPSASNASYYVPPMHANSYSHHGIYGPPPPLTSDPIYTYNDDDDDDESVCSIM